MKKGEKAAPYIVRARVRRDLENLIAKARIETTPILRTPENDYQWRIVVNEGGLAHIFGALMDTISYSNFKDAVKHTPGQENKVTAYTEIWGAMWRVQEREKQAGHPLDETPWCDSCGAWHMKPTDAAMHRRLRCKAPLPRPIKQLSPGQRQVMAALRKGWNVWRFDNSGKGTKAGIGENITVQARTLDSLEKAGLIRRVGNKYELA